MEFSLFGRRRWRRWMRDARSSPSTSCVRHAPHQRPMKWSALRLIAMRRSRRRLACHNLPHADAARLHLDWISLTSPRIRIAVLHFSHETVTFLRNDTTLGDFVYPGSPAHGEELLATGPDSYMGGFVQVAREYGGVELVGIESPLFPKTRTGTGWL